MRAISNDHKLVSNINYHSKFSPTILDHSGISNLKAAMPRIHRLLTPKQEQ